jgi:multidrug efflux pump
MQARNQLLGMTEHEPNLMGVRPNGLDDEPEYKLDVDWEKASAFGVSVSDINNSLSGAWGSAYVNQFVDRGRVKRVFIQGDPSSRMSPQDLDQWYVRNSSGGMVPFSAFMSATWAYGSPKLERYNGLPSFEILGQPPPGRSTGTAIQTMEQLAKRLPAGVGYEWTGLSYEEQLSSGEAPVLYALSLIVVFLCLAALYESWSIPSVVMLVVPLGVVGAVLATTLRGLDNDVFFQVGLLTTVGLSAKNAILIVEFAKENFDRGLNLVEATLDAARQRLRPILMTSFAFIMGVLPLAISTGAGSGGQNAIGTGVVGGMLSATVLAVFFVPMFFVAVLHWLRVRPQSADDEAPAARLPLPQGES